MSENEVISQGSVPCADVTAVILAGGVSRRMGRDKALLKVGGISLFERVLAVAQPLVGALLIAGDRPDLARPGIPCVPDIYPGSSLGGLHTGLHYATTPFILALACDMPFLESALLAGLLARRYGQDAVVPRLNGRPEPLCALYSRACLPAMEQMLSRGELRIFELYARVRTCFVDVSATDQRLQRALCNLNTPEELQHHERLSE